jgi:hypothetical protein
MLNSFQKCDHKYVNFKAQLSEKEHALIPTKMFCRECGRVQYMIKRGSWRTMPLEKLSKKEIQEELMR